MSQAMTVYDGVSPRLLFELIQYTIDFLCFDRQTLLDCSLVNSWWCDAARYHLFGDIVLRDRHSYERFRDVVDRNPSIAGHVRKLTLGGPRSIVQTKWIVDALDLMKRRLCNVSSLSVQLHASAPPLGNGATAAFVQPCPSVKDLGLTRVTFQSAESFAAFLAAFPNVRRLQVNCLDWTSGSLSTLDSLRFSQQLRGLSVLSSNTRDMETAEWLDRCGALKDVDRMTFATPELPAHESMMARILGSRGQKLKHLSLQPAMRDWAGAHALKLNLSANPNLGHIMINNIIVPTPRPLDDSPGISRNWVADFISHLPQNVHPHTITLVVHALGPIDPGSQQDLDWAMIAKALEPALISEAAPLLRLNVVFVSMEVGPKEWWQPIQQDVMKLADHALQEMQSLQARDVLRVFPWVPWGGEVLWKVHDSVFF